MRTILFAAWLPLLVLAKSDNSTAGLLLSSSGDAKNLGIPSDFKVDILVDASVPIVAEEIYRMAIHMMYDISGFPLQQIWLDREWPSRIGPSMMRLEHEDLGGKDPSKLSTQYIIWGLNHMVLSMYLSGRYCQTSAVLKWQGAQVGTIRITTREVLGLPSAPRNSTDVLHLAHQDKSGPVAAGEDVHVSVKYSRSSPIDRRLIFLTAIKAMGEACETGLNRPVGAMITQGIQKVSWKLVGGTQAFTGILKPGHSRIAIAKTLAMMIEEGRFQKIIVWVKVNGQNTAVGSFSQGEPIPVLS